MYVELPQPAMVWLR